MRIKYLSVAVALCLSQAAPAQTVSCLSNYKSPDPTIFMLDVPVSLTMSGRNYSIIKDPISGSEIRDYTRAGRAQAAQIDALGPIIDRLWTATSVTERRKAALDFSVQFATIAFTMLKQAEGIVETGVCKGENYNAKGLAFMQLNLKLQSVQQTFAVANRYLHNSVIGSMSGDVGQALLESTQSADDAKMANEGLLRIRQYYYFAFKAMELGAVAGSFNNSNAQSSYRNYPELAAQAPRLKQAFQDSRTHLTESPHSPSIEFVLNDLN